MPGRIRSLHGDTVDLIAWRSFGDTGMTVAILDANPGLAQLGPVLPTGTLVTLPERSTTPQTATPITLW